MKKRIFSFIMTLAIFLPTAPSALSANTDFTDVPQTHWAYNTISELTSNGVISGMGDGTFQPDGLVTREQFMKLLVCALDLETENKNGRLLTDVNSDDWSAPYIYAGIKRGIYSINNSGDVFYPQSELKRGISAEWIVDGLGVNTDANNIFSDISGSGKQSKDIAAAAKLNIITGYEDNTFRAENTITRAEAATLIKRVMDYCANEYSLRKDSKNEIELQDDVEMAESDKSVNVPTSVDKNGKTITFSNADETIQALGKGSILYILPCDNFKNGFLGKVVSVSGDKNIKIKFEEPELAEVIKSADISTYVSAGIENYSDDGDIKAVSAVKGVESKANGLTIDGTGNSDADVDISWRGVKLNAYANADEKANIHFETESYKDKKDVYAAIDLSMEAKVDIQLETNNLDISKFEASADLMTDINAVGGYNNSASKEYSYELPSCSIPVAGLFNVVVNSSLVVAADGSLNIEATADFDNDMGAKFSINDGFTTHNTTTAETGITVDADGSLKMGPKEELTLTFAGVEVAGHKFFDGVSILEADASFGIKANGQTKINKNVTLSDNSVSFNSSDAEQKHLCYFCIEGEISKYFDGNIGIGGDIQDLINKICDKQLTYNFGNTEDKISDWHLSTGDGYTLEFELQKCPHYLYKTIFEVKEAETQAPVPNASIKIKKESLTTDQTGCAGTFIADGQYEVTIECDGYKAYNGIVDVLNNHTLQVYLEKNFNIKDEILSVYDLLITNAYNENNGSVYSLYDIDKDGIVELIIDDNRSNSVRKASFYTYNNGAQHMGDMQIGSETLCEYPDGNGFARLWAAKNYESLALEQYIDGEFVSSMLNEGRSVYSMEEYSNPEDLYPGAYALPTCSTNSDELLKAVLK